VYPRLPFLNGFCLLLRRSVLEDVGLFDEDAFGRGYGEENDYCLRAGRAGWELAVADDAYVVHRVGRSYTEERRRPLSRAAHETLLARHGKEFVEERTDVCRHDRVLEGVRARVRAIAAREAVRTAAREAWAGKRVAFVLPVHRPGGGANIVMHEAEAMWRMGVAVSLVNLERNRPGFTKSYADNRVPAVYARDETAIADALAGYDAVFATWCESVNWLDRLPDNGTRTVRAYYIQDFEPYFFQPGSEGYQVAWNSYTRYPDLVRVAKTEWDRDEVARRIGVDSVVGGPTLDIDLHRPRRREGDWPARPLRILAMVRPSTPRRAPRLTMDVLREVERSRGDAVEIVIFGCESHDPQFLDLPRDFRWRNAGVLNRLEVAALVNEVDVFVDFSEFQAQGLTAMEGMACGVAVVAPRRGGATSFVRDGLNGLVVDTSSYDACLHAVLRLVDDDRLRLAIQRQAIHDICDFFPERGAFRTLEAVLGDGVSAAQAVLTEAGAT